MVLYLNNAGTSFPKPESVVAQVERALSRSPRELAPDIERAEASVAHAFALPTAGSLLWTPGCTAALAMAIESLPWAAGDRVVTSALEHHAVDGPVRRLARDRGVVHETAPYAPGRPFDLDWLRETLARGGVRLVAFSAASNVTGEILPAAEIAQLAHVYDALSLMDAAQTAGAVPLDAEALGVDMLCFAGHKGPLGPQGVGALWMSDQVAFACPSAACAVGEAAASTGRPGYCDVGGLNVAGALGVAAGLSWLAERPEACVAARRMARDLFEALRARDGVTVYGGDGPRTAAVSFRIDALPLPRVHDAFSRRDIVVAAGTHCAPRALEALGAEDGTLRVSFGVFNDPSDVERVLDAVDACQREEKGAPCSG